MSILKDFYKISSIKDNGDGIYSVAISLNSNHEIFQGHFPENPVTPGVCMMQIVKDLTEEISGKKLFMASASNVKFMAIINPEETPDLILEIQISKVEDSLKIKNTTHFGETIALKMNVNYKILS